MNQEMKYTFCILSIFFFFSSIFAQEKQVAFFPESDVFTIDKSYAKKLSLFTEYEDFVEAKLFQLSENEFAIEIYYSKKGVIYKERKVVNGEQKDFFISGLRGFVAKQNPDLTKKTETDEEVKMLNQKGRPGLLVTSTVVGLGYYGYAVPFMLNTESSKLFIAAYMLSSGASFLIPYNTTKSKDVSLSQVSMSFYGQSRGILHGILMGYLLTDPIEYDDNYYYSYEEQKQKEDRRNQVIFGLGILTSIGEGIAGFKLAEQWDYSTGSASMFQMWGDVGSISGLLFSDLFGFYENQGEKDVLSTVLLSSFAGLGVGKYLTDRGSYTVGDALFYRSSLLLGGALAPLLVYYFEPHESEFYSSAALLGGLGGAFLANNLLEDIDFTTGQGLIIATGEIAGCLLGLGIGYLLTPEIETGKFLMTTGAIGAISGYALTYKAFKHKALKLNPDIDVDVSLNPAGFLMKDYFSENIPGKPYPEMIKLRVTF